MQVPRVFVILGVVLIVVLGGLSISGLLVADGNEFERRQECSKYVAAIEKEFEESTIMATDFSSWANSRLLEMFYSRSRHSCLYTSEYTSSSDSMWIFSYTLKDALSGEQLLNTTPLIVGQADFDQKKRAFFDAIEHFR